MKLCYFPVKLLILNLNIDLDENFESENFKYYEI